METIVHVDAFADRLFAGNPAAVCALTKERSDEWMQQLAGEINLPATVFVLPRRQGYSIRWFTPSVELTLCGHGTLAAAHALWTEALVEFDKAIAFHSTIEILTARFDNGWIYLDFPALATAPVDIPAKLIQGLGGHPLNVTTTNHSYLVELGSEEEVRSLKPEISQIAELEVARVIVTARANRGDFDFVSRFFAPSLGLTEDHVTGSAHCALGPYWANLLNKTKLMGYQASARGGVVRVEVKGDRVLLGGRAVTVVRSRLCAE